MVPYDPTEPVYSGAPDSVKGAITNVLPDGSLAVTVDILRTTIPGAQIYPKNPNEPLRPLVGVIDFNPNLGSGGALLPPDLNIIDDSGEVLPAMAGSGISKNVLMLAGGAIVLLYLLRK